MHVLIPALHRPVKPTGVCRHAVNLAECLAAIDHIEYVTLLIGKWQRAYFERSFNLNASKTRLIDVDIKNSSLNRNQWFLLGLPDLAARIKPDIVHMSFPFPFIRRWFEMPVISTVHDLYPYKFPENFGYPQVLFNQLFLQQCVRSSDGIVCVSKCTLADLEAYFPKITKEKPARIVYNSVNFNGIKPTIPRTLQTYSEKSFLLTVAQHRKNKNLDLLIQVYSRLLIEKKISHATQLLIVGSPGPETSHLTELIDSLKLTEKVLFLSGLEDGELRWLYENAELFVIPSSAEGFCLPLAEALALACPAVCSDIPILREVGSSKCRYFQLGPQGEQNLLDAIAAELSLDSHKREIDTRFSKEKIAQQILDFYQSFKR